ncbi:enoyl-CoA hydratase/isomerase family protein [Salicibibacter cibarius]|uniref:Enoyl-CoA hydratase/isomerase family protein n=1 Tax=Salicibibacter cibarius TaxID=2743000 RepID=A0A7T6Z6V8_9BACI|nr:enoyl-CoA hydratase/isomerase family protein [Salicibibacter cibarius]QQK77772.1 enoyl-CoA hydratase/isomerase family protein [Salicibibacter cibarius]
MDTHNPLIKVECKDHIAVLALNNPPLNLVTLELTKQLQEELDEIEENEDIRVVIITGSSETKAFSAGSDITEFETVSDDIVGKKLGMENQVFSQIESLSKPTIAAIEGLAYGGGCELSLTCDLRIVSEQVKFSLPEIKLGAFPGSGGIFRLPKIIGLSKSLEMMYLGNKINAQTAEKMGLANHIVPEDETLSFAIRIAEEITEKPREALKAIKRGARNSLYHTHDEAVAQTLQLIEQVVRTDDYKEGVTAFFERRKPHFK